ncbi:MAG: FAD/NAD(P)-binding protein [Acidimicrobiales bacterium]
MYEVVSQRRDLDDTITLELDPVDAALSAPTMGRFNMLWAFGIGEAPISLAGVANDRLVHTIRAVGSVTNALCALKAGDQVGVRGPYGTGWDLQSASGRDVLVIAGGLGLAPVRPIITELFADRENFGRAALLVGARSPDQLLYRSELEVWRARLDIEVEVTVDSADATWRGDVGVVTTLLDRAPFDPAATRAFVCGPEVMMRFAARDIAEVGVPRDQIFLSLERNMHCAVGHCGHCQLGAEFICKDGPVLPWTVAEPLLRVRER